MTEARLRIGLFIGGSSSEKEISLESGRHVYNNLDREKYEIIPIFVDSCHQFWQIPEPLMWKNTTKDLEEGLGAGSATRIYWEGLKGLIDFAFIALHGKFGEDAILGLFEILNIPSNGASVLGGTLSMDKFTQRKVLMAQGIRLREGPVPCRFRAGRVSGLPFYGQTFKRGEFYGTVQSEEPGTS